MKTIRRRLSCLLLTCVLLLSMIPAALAAPTPGLDNFKRVNTYTPGHFTDVDETIWYAGNIKSAYELNLTSGTGPHTFDPQANMTVVMSIALAARLHAIYHTGSAAALVQGSPWYQVYVDYALANGIMEPGQFTLDPTAIATRAQCAVLLSKAIPAAELPAVNTVEEGAIPDVSADSPYYDAIYALYRAGILTGNDAKGTFTPDAPIDRASMLTIATRLVDKSLRRSVTLKKDPSQTKLTAQEISAKCADAVFYIETYAFNGERMGSGSGFFLSSDGLAVTNFHVAANTCMMKVITKDAAAYTDITIIDADAARDLVLLRVNGGPFPYLETGDSRAVVQGQTVYTIGSPYGLQNTMSQGLISHPSRALEGEDINYIQISAQITHGSSGGALLDEYGRVIGVTSGGFTAANADLNLAVPIHELEVLDKTSTANYWLWDETYYPDLSCALDFGAFSGVELLDTEYTPTGAWYYYDLMDFHTVGEYDDASNFAQTIFKYSVALEAEGLPQVAEIDNGYLCSNGVESVYVLWHFDEQILSILAEEEVQYYAEFPALPDLGWYLRTPALSSAYPTENSLMYYYDLRDVYTEEELTYWLGQYFTLLVEDGFVLVHSDDTAALFEGNGLSVVYLESDGLFYVDVAPL